MRLEYEWVKWKISIGFNRKASEEQSVANTKRQGVLLVRQTDSIAYAGLTNMWPASRMRPSVTRISAVTLCNKRNIIIQQNIMWQLYKQKKRLQTVTHHF